MLWCRFIGNKAAIEDIISSTELLAIEVPENIFFDLLKGETSA